VTFGIVKVDSLENESIAIPMANLTNEENWAARERLRRVEFLLWWRGWVGRQDLVDVFGISPAQASGDLQRYAGMNGGAMIYHTSRKRYEAVEGMVCMLHEPSFEEAVMVFLGGAGILGTTSNAGDVSDPRLSVIGLPTRRLDVGIARRVLMALLERRCVRVRYVSVNSGNDGWRWLVPSGLAWDGRRWHVRAWCGTRNEWRDFVFGRMISAEWPSEPAKELPEDKGWTTFEIVKLRINPNLDTDQREALRMDYDLAGDTVELRVRASMKPYLLAAMFIDHESHSDLPRHFVLE
jgi:hypothetical protein